jgi:hypothetical protein
MKFDIAIFVAVTISIAVAVGIFTYWLTRYLCQAGIIDVMS